MRLSLGPRSYDLSTRALVMGVSGAPEDLVDQGADIVELPDPFGPATVPVCVVVSGPAALERALAAGAALVRLPEPFEGALARCARAGAAVVVPKEAVAEATAAGLAADRIVPGTLLVDVTGEGCPTAATAVGVIRGARLVRTAHVKGARRVCDVLAAVLEAR